ncbi:MAG: sugar transferase [Candidatus Portnoybacteria bacterium]|nr:sugar transferase [Candidatus Portnoybacteria bacterium]
MKKSELIFSLIQIPLDFLMVVTAGIAAYFLRTSQWVAAWRPVMFHLPFFEYVGFLVVIGLLSLIFFAFSGLYQLKVTRSLVREIFLVILAVTAGVVALALWVFFSANPFESRFIILFWWIFAILLVSFGRITLKKIQQNVSLRLGIGRHNVLLIGHPNPGRSKEFLEELKRNPGLGYQVVGEVLTLNLRNIETMVKSRHVDDVFLTDLSWSEAKVLELAQFCHRMQLNFSFVPSVFTSFRTDFKPLVRGLALLEVKHTPLEGWGKLMKRGMDIVGAILGLILLGILYPFVTLAIIADSKGPVIIGLKRAREGGKPFFLYKFRSMVHNAHRLKYTMLKKKNERKGSPLFKIKNDPRVTRVGKFLRRFRIDELPNFYNVLKGDMSLIGPRPHEPEEVAKYKKQHLRVLSIRPGVTGLAQISGASDLPFEREVELDTYYIEHWSLLLDLYILARTVVFIFRDKAAV